MQSGSGADLYTQLIEKCPRVTVDESGGLFPQSTGLSEAHIHILTSGENRG